MNTHRVAPIVCSLLLTALLGADAHSGVRVDEPRSTPLAPHAAISHRSNLQVGYGPALLPSEFMAGSLPSDGWNATAAIERVHSPRWSWIVRGEFASFEHTSAIGLVRGADLTPPIGGDFVTQRDAVRFAAVELGVRVHAPIGPAYPYVEFAAGCGSHLRHEETRASAAPEFDRDATSHGLDGTLDFAIGGAWQPVGAPIGFFAELRSLSEVGAGGASWLAPRLGLMAHRL